MTKYTIEELKDILEELEARDWAIVKERSEAQSKAEWRASNVKLRQNLEEMDAVKEEIRRRKNAA